MLRSRFVFLCLALAALSFSQAIDPKLYDCLSWRCIGPYRGGRTVGAVGVPGEPNVFYIGVNNGGVWKTDDSGRTWDPLFDSEPTGSIGAIAVSASNPSVVYVGTGEGLQRPDLSIGDGVYKSIDGGASWKHLGLRDAQQIAAIAVDPENPDKVLVAVLGHPYGANEERGLYRSMNGGETFTKVLDKGPETGAVAVVIDPNHPNTLYCDMWSSRQGPRENTDWQGPNSGLFKSTDGGDTWTQLTNGLPNYAGGLGRIGIALSRSNSNRLYAMVDAERGGVYRSDDAGTSWRLVNSEGRIWGRGEDFAEIEVDPMVPDTVYVANTSMYRSTDGGSTFICIKGSPGGDDYHTIWINPTNPDIILLAGDQGAAVSVNRGRTWSSWYNQPTAQFYHVATDNQFPYHVYGGQQESGSAEVASRGNDGQITFREWHPVGVEEYGYVAPDPLHPNWIYGGKVTRYDRITGQVADVGPTERRARGGQYRFLRTAPLIFSPVDLHTLYLGGNVLFKTENGGSSWSVISPDLTWSNPPAAWTHESSPTGAHGVIYSIGLSPLDKQVIWAGNDDGLVHLTTDGGARWTDVTPPGTTPWSKVAQIDAGHFDRNTAYIAVNRIKLDDVRPHIYKTYDAGKTWSEIDEGLPNDPVNTVREDPKRKGLLFAGTERAVFFSADDGAHWNPLRLNMPASSIRDLVIHGDDLVVGTHGRGFWILDGMTALRQLGSETRAALYKPGAAVRVHWNNNTDTPLPPEEPGGQNPPDGAAIDYYLAKPANDLTLQILDSRGEVVNSFSSHDSATRVDPRNITVMPEWIKPPQILSGGVGSHRFVWNLHYGGFPQPVRFVSMAAIWHQTSVESVGPWVMPGSYTVRLTIDGQMYSQPLEVTMDPRVETSKAGIARQFEIAKGSYDAIRAIQQANEDLAGLSQKSGRKDSDLTAVRAGEKVGPGLSQLQGQFASIMGSVEQADFEPRLQVIAQYKEAKKALAIRLAQVKALKP